MLKTLRESARGPAAIALLAFSMASFVAPAVQAGTIPTAAALHGAAADQQRARVIAMLARDDVRAQLVARGVDPAVVEARVAALSDAEVERIAQQMDQMPAGGGLLGAVVLVFFVLLITDLLGWTDVFPFTKKGSIKTD